jgi:hypothetical protein
MTTNRVKTKGPTCVVVEPGDKRAACGKRSEETGITWCRWVDAHRSGHSAAVCIDCALAFDRLDWLGEARPDARHAEDLQDLLAEADGITRWHA